MTIKIFTQTIVTREYDVEVPDDTDISTDAAREKLGEDIVADNFDKWELKSTDEEHQTMHLPDATEGGFSIDAFYEWES